VSFALAEIDLDYVGQVRASMPVRLQRRPDLYGELRLQDKVPSKRDSLLIIDSFLPTLYQDSNQWPRSGTFLPPGCRSRGFFYGPGSSLFFLRLIKFHKFFFTNYQITNSSANLLYQKLWSRLQRWKLFNTMHFCGRILNWTGSLTLYSSSNYGLFTHTVPLLAFSKYGSLGDGFVSYMRTFLQACLTAPSCSSSVLPGCWPTPSSTDLPFPSPSWTRNRLFQVRYPGMISPLWKAHSFVLGTVPNLWPSLIKVYSVLSLIPTHSTGPAFVWHWY